MLINSEFDTFSSQGIQHSAIKCMVLTLQKVTTELKVSTYRWEPEAMSHHTLGHANCKIPTGGPTVA